MCSNIVGDVNVEQVVNSRFLHLSATIQNHKTCIYHITNINGSIYTNCRNVEGYLLECYSKLWTSTTHFPFYDTLMALPTDLNTFSNIDKKYLVEPIIEAEIYQTFCLFPSGKSPSLDGFIVEFYCFFWKNIRDQLFKVINYFLDLHISQLLE